MRVKTLFSLLLVTVPATVSACEGDCIVGITNAFIGNYTERVRQVWTNAVSFTHCLIFEHAQQFRVGKRNLTYAAWKSRT